MEERLLELLRGSIEKRMMADVPFGVFLSGGVDSSTNVALMSELMDEPVRTFSSASSEHEQYNEFEYARAGGRALRHRPPRGPHRRGRPARRSCPSWSTTRTSRSRTGCACRCTSSRSSRARPARSSCRSARARTSSSTATELHRRGARPAALLGAVPAVPAPLRRGGRRARRPRWRDGVGRGELARRGARRRRRRAAAVLGRRALLPRRLKERVLARNGRDPTRLVRRRASGSGTRPSATARAPTSSSG